METTVKAIGVYIVQNAPSVYLVEIKVRNCSSGFDVGGFTQEIPNTPKTHWQVPYSEKIFDATGEKEIADALAPNEKGDLWSDDFRLIFFFHDLDLSKPLETPFGKIDLPRPTNRPARLSAMEYVPPD